MGIPVEISMGMDMGWLWELCWISMGFVGILWEFLDKYEIKRKRIMVFQEPKAAGLYVAVAAARWRNPSYV